MFPQSLWHAIFESTWAGLLDWQLHIVYGVQTTWTGVIENEGSISLSIPLLHQDYIDLTCFVAFRGSWFYPNKVHIRVISNTVIEVPLCERLVILQAKRFLHHRPLVRGIHRWPVDSLNKGSVNIKQNLDVSFVILNKLLRKLSKMPIKDTCNNRTNLSWFAVTRFSLLTYGCYWVFIGGLQITEVKLWLYKIDMSVVKVAAWKLPEWVRNYFAMNQQWNKDWNVRLFICFTLCWFTIYWYANPSQNTAPFSR